MVVYVVKYCYYTILGNMRLEIIHKLKIYQVTGYKYVFALSPYVRKLDLSNKLQVLATVFTKK